LIDSTTTINNSGFTFPEKFQLHQNYPDPFNSTTMINYQLLQASKVNLDIYSLMGQELETLLNYWQNSGEHSLTWNATDHHGNPVSSGMYFCHLQTDDMTPQRKMVLVR
jgi:flagellar hook assembly protein FlgD